MKTSPTSARRKHNPHPHPQVTHISEHQNSPKPHHSNQKDRFSCPGVNTYFTAAVLFGSLGARKVFGSGGIYTALLSAFPVGFAIPILFYVFQRRFPRTHWVAKIHPVMILSGGISWSPVSQQHPPSSSSYCSGF